MHILKNTDSWQKIQTKAQQIWAHKSVSDWVSPDWFLPEFWQQNNGVIGQSKGRYITYFVEHNANQQSIKMVLRHYYRGGFIRKLSRDRFIFTAHKKTRAFSELSMLHEMRELGLPVPNPIAAMVTKVGWFKCVNDILIELISDAKDGFQLLSKQAFTDSQWQEIGRVVKRFHNKGVFHSDLNIHNIMFQSVENNQQVSDSGISENIANEDYKVWLIDFDRCSFRTPATDWQQANLNRLKRSLEKEKNLNIEFCYTEQNWQQLMAGYNQ